MLFNTRYPYLYLLLVHNLSSHAIINDPKTESTTCYIATVCSAFVAVMIIYRYSSLNKEPELSTNQYQNLDRSKQETENQFQRREEEEQIGGEYAALSKAFKKKVQEAHKEKPLSSGDIWKIFMDTAKEQSIDVFNS